MKKTASIMLATIATLTTLTACTPSGENVNESSQTSSYNETVSNRDEVDTHEVEVFKKIVSICNNNDTITRGEDKIKDDDEVIDYLTSNTDHIPMLDLYVVKNVDCEHERIIFSFDNDTKVILADPLEEELLDEQNYIVPDYMKFATDTNSSQKGNCLAWSKDRNSYLVVDGQILTSVWSYNESEKIVSLIWFDSQNPVWQNYKAG